MISLYLEKMAAALRGNARQFYFPMDKERRRDANLRLGRELGYGVGAWDKEDRDSYIRALYGRFLVANSLDSIGVMIDSKEWLDAVLSGIAARISHDQGIRFEPIDEKSAKE